ncbi:hypothetical protein HDV04_002850 [Boothiomyces sp. JEL0838]|nr:hypothetical protein HDV04_002850 [Boothiomyces sp. JEL0838]
MLNPTDPVLVDTIWADINQGWQVVKILEIFIVPYCYLVLYPNRVAQLLFIATLLAIAHNIFSMIAYYIGTIDTSTNTTTIWLFQALCAAFIRIIEMVVNWIIISAMTSPKKSSILKIVTGFTSAMVLFGRVYDVYGSSFLQITTIRWGMAIVSLGGVIQSVVGLIFVVPKLRKLQEYEKMSGSIIGRVATKSAFRLIFIQMIDVLLIADFLYLKTNVYFLWLHQVADNLDNSRTIFLMLDIVFSKLLSGKGDGGKNASFPQSVNGATSAKFKSEIEK